MVSYDCIELYGYKNAIASNVNIFISFVLNRNFEISKCDCVM